MPQVPFSTYTLNNDNAECGYILVFDCSLGNFVFMNPCELIEGCHININNLIDWNTFNWCNMVTSPLIPNAGPGKFLRINQTGTCVEWADINNIINQSTFSYKVKVTNNDTPNYLGYKIVGVPGRTIVSIIPGQYVQIDVDQSLIGTNIPTPPNCVNANDNPTGYAQLVYDVNNGVHWECQQNRGDAIWHQRFLPSDTTWNSGSHPWWVPGGTVGGANYWYVPCSGSEGNSSMKDELPGNIDGMGFNNIAGQNVQIPAIRIKETGLYAVWANVDVLISGAINAVRFFLYTNNSKRMILNMKESNEGISLVPTGATGVTKNFSGYNFVKLNAGDYVFMGVRVYTPTSNPFSMTIISQAYPLAYPFNVGPSGNLCGTTFGCMLVSKSLLNSS